MGAGVVPPGVEYPGLVWNVADGGEDEDYLPVPTMNYSDDDPTATRNRRQPVQNVDPAPLPDHLPLPTLWGYQW